MSDPMSHAEMTAPQTHAGAQSLLRSFRRLLSEVSPVSGAIALGAALIELAEQERSDAVEVLEQVQDAHDQGYFETYGD